MQFYKIYIEGIKGLKENVDNKDQRKQATDYQGKIIEFFEENDKQIQISISFINFLSKKAEICASVKDGGLTQKKIKEFTSFVGLEHKKIIFHETTIETYVNMLQAGERNRYIYDASEIVEKLSIYNICKLGGRFFSLRYTETVLSDLFTREDIESKSKDILCEESLIPEIDRIYEIPAKRSTGHPIHYLLQADNEGIRDQIIELLLTALYNNGRIQSRRFCHLSYSDSSGMNEKGLDTLYETSIGGTIVISYKSDEVEEHENAYVDTEVIIKLCEVMKKYRSKVLTIFCLPRTSEKIKNVFYQYLGTTTMIPLGEETVFGERAKMYLSTLAKKHGERADKSLYRPLVDEGKGFLVSDIHQIFDEWYEKRLKTHVYKQYAEFENANKQVIAKKPRGSAYDELEKMIGLVEAKKLIHKILDFHKAQMLFRGQGMDVERPAMHMVFSGNPGTAKTSIARIFAQIMKDNDLLSVGNLFEVGRSDLVGKYVGWTAKIVKEKFEAAEGSVLFIDEAYSLVDDRDGSYGDEAINTIVQEMENHREDIIVIFAGYPDKMKKFLNKNPGLNSRIAFHVPFEDYNADELCQITELMGEKKKMMMGTGVLDKLRSIYEDAMQSQDFGNGRFARNMIEMAIMNHATRMVSMDAEKISQTDIATLLPEDFEAPVETQIIERKVVGF